MRYPSTQALITRAENALFQRAYGDTELTEHMSERADPEAKNAVQALMNTAARVAEIQDRIRAGELHDIDFAGDLAEAAKQYVELKRTGQNVQDWLDQESLFDQDETVRSLVGMMEKYKRSGVKLTGAINDILDQVEAAGNPGQTSLIETAVPTKGEIVERAQGEDGMRYSIKGGIAFAVNEDYETLLDTVREYQSGGYIKIGSILEGSVLNQVGLPATGLYFDISKIQKALNDHSDHIDEDVLRIIPNILRDPIVIAEADVKDTINVFGMESINDSPIMVGILVRKDRNGENVITKVRTIHAQRNLGSKISDGSVLYLSENKEKTREWFQARDNVVPLGGARFGVIRRITLSEDLVNPQNTENRHSLRATDADYMAAVRRGDMDTARRMVDEAARSAGYNYVRYTRRELNPKNNEADYYMFVEADKEYLVEGTYGNNKYFATDKSAVDMDDISEEVKEAWNRFAEETAQQEWDDDFDINPDDIVDSAGIFDNMDFMTYLWESGFFDRFGDETPVIRTHDGLVVFGDDYSIMKSGAPVVYDDNGNVIPLSERFDPENPDIRYSLRDFSQMSDREIVGEVMDLRNLTPTEKDYIKSYKNAYWQGKNLQEEIGRRERGTAGRAYGHLTKKFDEI